MAFFPEHILIVIIFTCGVLIAQLIDIDHKMSLKKGLRCMSVNNREDWDSFKCGDPIRGGFHSYLFQLIWLGLTVGLILHWIADGVFLSIGR